ncbi:YqiA/YcfP family alpha/beta fold hydrolase [Psychrobacter jeotgali]|uniref:YqiA/YcfP family alpha/beta fold hydrolase n=1 Tax=Psychrobacter jeotgali TaxID=179010 RepID=UPI00191A5886|nr:YqiA/YcfP family alpha/beta fold hydrolase [Psychrobacter jeotgali]
MNIVYIHGLDSDSNSTKGKLLEDYCQKYHPAIKVHRPDLNQSPEQVFNDLTNLVVKLSKDAKTALVGSSLGGYFSTLVSNQTGCPILLLNPSTQPHITLQRFASEADNQKILYTTSGGWEIVDADLQWFAAHKISPVEYPDKVAALIKEEDELLDSDVSANFYRQHGAQVIMQKGGDHRFTDFAEHLPQVIAILQNL